MQDRLPPLAREEAHDFDLYERRPGSDGRRVAYCLCGRIKGHPIHHGGGHRSQKVYGGHPFRLGGTREAKDGRVMHVCADCGSPTNAPTHRASAIPGEAPPKPKAARRPRATTRALGSPDVVVPTDGGPGSPGAERPRAPKSVSPGDHVNGVESVPPPARPRTVRPEKAGAEVVALAITLDAVLALPPDRISWKVRLKMVALRDALPVASIPSLADSTEEVEDAPSETIIAAMPELQPRTRPTTVTAGADSIVKGIRSDRHRELVRRAIKAGWTVHKTGGGHIALDHGSSRLIVSTTANNDRMGHGWGNLRAQAKRMGLDVAGL